MLFRGVMTHRSCPQGGCLAHVGSIFDDCVIAIVMVRQGARKRRGRSGFHVVGGLDQLVLEAERVHKVSWQSSSATPNVGHVFCKHRHKHGHRCRNWCTCTGIGVCEVAGAGTCERGFEWTGEWRCTSCALPSAHIVLVYVCTCACACAFVCRCWCSVGSSVLHLLRHVSTCPCVMCPRVVLGSWQWSGCRVHVIGT